jgi:hypothetical protein
MPADGLERMAKLEISEVIRMEKYIVESEILIRAVDKPFNQRQALGIFYSAEEAYRYIEKYLSDTKDLHTYFARQIVCSKEDYPEYIESGQIVAINIVLGQFEDMIYVRKSE